MATGTKMLQILIDGQASIKRDIKDLGKKLTDRIDGVETKLTSRIDKLGLQIASLEDDAPTNDEFEKLEKRVTKIEHKLAD